MPNYEYFCENCKKKFEITATIQEKEKGLKTNCPFCGSNKTFQIFGGFFTFSKGSKSKSNSGCCPTSIPGCCG
jgi:putative FmdB family regulatory protein